MKAHTELLIVAASLLVLPASAQDSPPRVFGDGSLPAFLKQFDIKGGPDGGPDGILDEEERQAMREAMREQRQDRINTWDLDGDGVLSPGEIAAAREKVRQRIEERRTEHFLKVAGEDEMLSLEEFLALPPFQGKSTLIPTSIFNMMDSDKSGLVSLEEFTARLRPPLPRLPLFAAMDTNSDGVLDINEFITGAATFSIPEAAAREIFAHLDRDADGKLTPTDFPNRQEPPPPPPVLPDFKTVDTNKDMRLTIEEFLAATTAAGMPERSARDLFAFLDRNRDRVLGQMEYASAF
jgi:Ca2+-binding EF-hand superfamily protein